MAGPDSRVHAGRWLAVGLIALVGCAAPRAAEPVAPHLIAVPPPDVPADRPVLGVGRFIDRRPESERIASAPRLEMHWWGFSRSGREQSGDASFVSDLSEGARRDAASTLVRSGAFRKVLWVDADATGAAARAARGDVDWVLVAEIERLSGSRHRDLELNVGRVGWFRRRDGEPQGRATLRYRLYDARGSVNDFEVTRLHTSPGSSSARAALDALAAANEEAAGRIYREVVRERSTRSVSVRVLDACGLGRERALALVAEASDVFEREIDVRFDAERHAWVPEPQKDGRALDNALEHLRATDAPVGGVVVGLVPVPESGSELREGLALPLGRHAVVGCSSGDASALTLAHELGHLFGAVHVADRASVMSPRSDFEARFFDPLNRKVMRVTRERSFDEPLEPDVRAELAQLYAEAAASDPLVQPVDLEAAVAALQHGPVPAAPAPAGPAVQSRP